MSKIYSMTHLSGFYTSSATDSHAFDFFPASAERAPLLIYVHGGAWRFGSKDSLTFSSHGTHRLREYFSSHGFACVAINYQLSHEAKFPAQIHDVKAAIRYFRAHAHEFGIDPDRIVIAGGSAGGHLAMLAAATGSGADPFYESEISQDGDPAEVSSEVAAAISLYGVSDLRTIFSDRPLCGFALEHPEDDGAEWRLLGSTYPAPAGSPAEINWDKAHPIDLVNQASEAGARRCAPLYLLHGLADSCVPPIQSVRVFDALERQGVPTELLLVPEAEHADSRCFTHENLMKLVTWAQNTLAPQ